MSILTSDFCPPTSDFRIPKISSIKLYCKTKNIELHDVTLRIAGDRPAIQALNGDTVWLDRVKLVPESNVKPFDLTGIATLLYDRATGSNYYAPRIEFTDSVFGLPVEGIDVSLQGYGGTYKTDAQGMITIPVILGGSYELEISDSRFEKNAPAYPKGNKQNFRRPC